MITELKSGDCVNGRAVLFAARTAPYLQLVLAYWKSDGMYVIWTYNCETGGFGSGHYYKDPQAACEAYFKRLNASQPVS